MKLSNLLELLLLGAVWGGSFLLMRTATPEFGVFALVEIRTLFAALLLLPVVLLTKQFGDMKKNWKALLIVGLLNTAIPFSLFAYSSMYLDAGFNAILNATAPMFGALIAFVYLHEKISKLGVLGLLLGFIGVVVLGQDSEANSAATWLPIVSSLAAASCYGMAASYLKKHLSGVKPFAIATGSLFFASIMLLPFAIINWPAVNPSAWVWSQALTLSLVCTGIAYILYFDLIAKVGASKAMTVGYLVPLFGVTWGILLLGEFLSLHSAIGGALILIGLACTSGILNKKRRKKTPAPV